MIKKKTQKRKQKTSGAKSVKSLKTKRHTPEAGKKEENYNFDAVLGYDGYFFIESPKFNF